MTDKQAAARDWLQRNDWRADEIHDMQLKIEVMRESVAKSVNVPQENKVQTQPGNSTERMLAEIIDFEKEIENKRLYLAELQRASVDTISKMRDPIKKTLLVYRYIIRKHWREIARELHYTENYCFELHLRALDELYPFIDFSIR